MREIERFEVRAEDGPTWRFAKLVKVTDFKPLSGPAQQYDVPATYESLDEPGRFHINEREPDRFSLVDFGSAAGDVEVTRVRGIAPT